ncbi:DUF2326 domain-containing protein [Desulfobacula phenolica]|uniref:Uncharacterized protein YydD, contains DUF2326 domain n=1 Tax=Desulfobacula phenolica TaxID=90732 RepID=A0A1H2IDI4_9BACT|nr:DUF2326 domain-containing protein [Desulfobacula phenolica]SDU42065.1 Uncharacterized protein YydD, contains DUF2326 domain [Desulfobacula phenolica]
MLKLHKLYSEPELFDPIPFHNGINLILGETNESSDKTNGVGKSLTIEFIDFCLLKRFNDSRVSKIPENAFDHEAFICLDFSIFDNQITSKRSIKNQNTPILLFNGKETEYFDINDAKDQLTHLLFGSAINKDHPSFRTMLGPLIRDERSEFKSIVKCYDTVKNIPPDYSPHLYLLGINPISYNEAKELQKDIDNTTKARRKLKRDVEQLTGKTFSEANQDLNELTSQVEQIKDELEALENAESFKIIKEEVIELETKLDGLKTQAGAIKSELSKIRLFKGDNYIDESEVSALYDRFKQGLGDMIKREIKEVTEFKKKIDTFQKTLIDSRKTTLLDELNIINKEIKNIDTRYKEKLQILDKEGVLKSLKTTVSAYEVKLEEQSRLSSFIKKHDDYDQSIKVLKQNRSGKIIVLDTKVTEAETTTDAFEKTILDIHHYVMGNKRCSFKIKIKENKQVVEYELRIHHDGSHSNEREKVFIYDMALLLTPKINLFHPGLLIHDNIFDVDQDTLIKSLNYLAEKSDALNKKQYVLTLNSDKFHTDELKKLKLNIDQLKIASFTKTKKFLQTSYQEL